jgi:glycosyltransferase involved in cell wall biosynthesis
MIKKNILFTIGSLNMGGAEKVLINYINYFNTVHSTEFYVELLLISYEGKLLDELNDNIKISYLYKGNDSIIKNIFLLRILYKIYRKALNVSFKKFPILYNIFFSKYINYDYNFIFVQDLYWFSKTNLGKKKYLWIQNNLNRVAESDIFENHNFTSNIDKLIAISDGIYEDLITRLKIKPELIIKCNNPIDSSRISKLSEEVVIPYFDQPYLVSMGRLVDQKGFDILLESLALLKENNISIKLVIIGGGENHIKLLELAESLNLIVGVDFIITGLMANPYPIIKNSSIFVCSSRFDGLSTSINEAMCLKIPIISTPCDYGPKEIIGDNLYGIISSDISAKSLMINIKEMLDSDEMLNRYSSASLSRSLHFDIMNVGEILINSL